MCVSKALIIIEDNVWIVSNFVILDCARIGSGAVIEGGEFCH